MPSFVNTFGGTNIYPSDVSYRAITLAANTTLAWPTEVATDSNVAAEIMDVTATSGSLTIRMPPADEASVGQTALFFNPGSNAFTVADNGGNVITVVAAGESWQVYITGNATANGTWRTVEYGAGTSSVAAGSLAGKGIKAITTTLNQSMPVLTYPIIPGTYSYTLDEAQRASTIIWDSSTTGTLTLAGATTNGSDWFCHVRNNGAGSTIIACSPGDQINGLSSLTFGPGDSATLFCDGNNYFTIGQGNVSTSGILAFDYVSLDLTGVASPYILQGVELNRISYNFTGTLSSNMEIVVPLNLQQYWVKNSTSGPHSMTVKTLSGTGVQIQQGYAQILYCNGVNVVAANDPPGVTDIPVSAGGIYVDNFSGNGVTQVFTLTYAVTNEDRTQVYINGVYQQKNTYTVSGATLSFSVPPPASSTIEVVSLGAANYAASFVTLTPSGYTTAVTVQGGFNDLGSSSGASRIGISGGGSLQDFLTLQPFIYANSSSLYGIIDSTVDGSWVFGSYSVGNTNKLGVNNTKPTDEPSTGARTNDTAYTAGTADVAAIIAGYDNVNNAQAGIIASQHSMLYTGADHGAIIGGSLHTILDYTDYSGIFAGTSCTIENRGRYSAIIASQASKILTGATDDASGFRGFMASSSFCTIGGRNSAVINGISVDVLGQYCTVLNGSTVTIGASTTNCLVVGSNHTVGNVAAASQSLIVGNGNTVNGSRNLVVGDSHTVASYSYCTATGTGSVPPFSGSRVHTARNRASVAGSNMSLDFQCSNETTDTTITRLVVLGSAFPSQPINSIVTGAFYVTGVSAAGVSSAFRLDFSSLMGASGAPTIKGLTTTVLHDDLALPTDPTVVATSTGIYRVQVVGLAATNIRWNARFVGQQMFWG